MTWSGYIYTYIVQAKRNHKQLSMRPVIARKTSICMEWHHNKKKIFLTGARSFLDLPDVKHSKKITIVTNEPIFTIELVETKKFIGV